MKQLRRVGAFIYVPLLFLCFGYLIIYIIGAPVINFAVSAVELISLNDAPVFEEKGTNLYAQRKKTDESKDSESAKQQETEDHASAEPIVKNENGEKEAATEKLSSSKLVYPVGDDRFGEVIIDKVKINVPLYYGDSEEILRLGAGQYIGSMIPGELGTTLIGGHNMPSFGKIYYLEAGDMIEIRTHYGDYTYQVSDKKIANYKDSSINTRLGDRSKRSLILYTCYPLDAVGLTPERVFVFAEYVSGPIIDEQS
jgi:sortase A